MIDDLLHRFSYHAPVTDDRRSAHDEVRKLLHQAALRIVLITPDTRETSLAVTKLEEAMFWANASVARHG